MIHYLYFDEIYINNLITNEEYVEKLREKLKNDDKISYIGDDFFFFRESDIQDLNNKYLVYKALFNFNNKETLNNYINETVDGDLEYEYNNSTINIDSFIFRGYVEDYKFDNNSLELFMQNPEFVIEYLKQKIIDHVVTIEIACMIVDFRKNKMNIDLNLLDEVITDKENYSNSKNGLNRNEFKIL